MKKLFSMLGMGLLMSAPLLADDKPAAGRDGAFWQTIIMIGVAILFFYFILWRPEQKRRKELEKKRDALKKGDRVTAMGLVGIIDRIKDKTIVLKMIEGAKVEVLKGAVTEVLPPEGEIEEKTEA